MTTYLVTVPARTQTVFEVEASHERTAKREVGRWLRGARDEADDLFIVEPPGTKVWDTRPASWQVSADGKPETDPEA